MGSEHLFAIMWLRDYYKVLTSPCFLLSCLSPYDTEDVHVLYYTYYSIVTNLLPSHALLRLGNLIVCNCLSP
jgi:hypothetical protein